MFRSEKNVLEAAANGAATGVFLVANIIASLIAFLAFLAFFNSVVQWLGAMVGLEELSFEVICFLRGYLFFRIKYVIVIVMLYVIEANVLDLLPTGLHYGGQQ